MSRRTRTITDFWEIFKPAPPPPREAVPSDRVRTKTVADKLNTHVPDSTSIHFVWLPLIEALVERLEQLENSTWQKRIEPQEPQG